MDDILRSQINAGEAEVLKSLERKGLRKPESSEVSSAGLLSVWVVRNPEGGIDEIHTQKCYACGRSAASLNTSWMNLNSKGWCVEEMFLSDNG